MPTPTFSPVTPHIYKLDLPFFGGRLMVGVWLVRDERGWILVDAGAPGFEKTIVEQVLAATGGQTPYVLVLTHGHADHAAAAEMLHDLWKVPIAAGRDEIPYLLGPAPYARIPSSFPLYRFTQLSPAALIGRNVQQPLDDGMQVGPLRVTAAPGHAPGMVALLHAADRALICGDVFMSLGGKPRDPYAFFTYDMRLNRDSQARLVELDFDHLLPSHGPALLQTGRQQARAFLEKGKKKK